MWSYSNCDRSSCLHGGFCGLAQRRVSFYVDKLPKSLKGVQWCVLEDMQGQIAGRRCSRAFLALVVLRRCLYMAVQDKISRLQEEVAESVIPSVYVFDEVGGA